MQTRNPVLEDMARVMSGAAGVFAGLRREAEAQIRYRIERKMSELDLVPREDFDAVRAMASAARAAQEDLAGRVAALEARLDAMTAATPAPPDVPADAGPAGPDVADSSPEVADSSPEVADSSPDGPDAPNGPGAADRPGGPRGDDAPRRAADWDDRQDA